MKDEFEIKVAEDGTITTIYQENLEEDLAHVLGARVTNIERASLVEWELVGWTVRSAKNPEWAVRWEGHFPTVSFEGNIIYFATKKLALEVEEANFWKLLEGGSNGG